jgi:gingipain R
MRSRFSLCIALLLALGLAAGAWAGELVGVTVLENSADRVVIDYSFGQFGQQKVLIEGTPYSTLSLGNESVKHEVGLPALPDVSRSVIIPDDAGMAVRVLDSRYYEISGIDVAPSKGFVLRTVDKESVPFSFGKAYQENAFWPANLAELRTPYIMRDHRGVVVTVNPFQYNPVQRVLRVYTAMTVEVVTDGPGRVNVLDRSYARKLNGSFHDIYGDHFINYNLDGRYAPLDENGDMLIICHDAWTSNAQALASHKTSIGIPATVVAVSVIGNTTTAITNYIQNLYNTSDLAFVLLVGDSTEVVSPSSAGGASDPSYSKVAGGDDYPDIFIGRFSAQSAADVDTQVLRSVEYEENQATMETWFWRGMGIASNQGPGDDGEYDNVHIGNIRTDMLAGGYTLVDEIYDPSGTASQVTAGLNAGRGIINYCGHGSDTSWSSTGFSNTNVNALTNDNTLPFIFSVACVNGNFPGQTCFAEAWLRATNGGEPTGAVGAYMSSINQSWDPPMEGQDHFNAAYLAGTYNTYGALCYAGSCSMIDEYGSGGVDMFDTWHVFGDPSLRVVGTTAPPTGMKVTPGGGLISEGANGGPFTPSSLVYTLTNYENYALNYTVSESTSWLDISGTGGTIPALGTATVTVSINASAGSLANGAYFGDIDFVNTTNHDGDCSRTCQLTVGVPTVQYTFDMSSNPGWTVQGQWAWGTPTGGGGQYGNPDPTSGASGPNVYGYNLAGDYANSMAETHLTSTAVDCGELAQVILKFQRYLNVETPSYDHAYVRVSNNGSSWTTVWQNTSEVTDSGWSLQEFDISAVADGQSTVYLRWTMGTTDSSWQYSGWNIDDVEIWGVGETTIPPTDTVAVAIGCNPDSGVLPFTTQMAISLTNLTTENRRAAGRLDVVIGNGSSYTNWRAGWTNLSSAETFSSMWNQGLPGLAALVGSNVFTLRGADVTPAPYNQPPFAPAGDTDSDACTVIAAAP